MNVTEIECAAGQRPHFIVDAGNYLVAKVCLHFIAARKYIEFRYNEVLEQVACRLFASGSRLTRVVLK